MEFSVIPYLLSGAIILDSEGHSVSSASLLELLDFLLYSCSAAHTSTELRAFWDLDDAVSRIVSLLPVAARKSLAETDRAVWGGYRLFYIGGKLFSVSNESHDEATFHDLQQFFPDDSCDTIQQVQQKADLLLQTLADLGISSPSKLTSPVAIAEQSGLLREYQSAIPTIFDAPVPFWEAYEYALQCTPREWVSAYQVGSWRDGELFDYDLTSAYPSAASQLIDLRDCSFTRSDKMLDDAYYGFLYGDLYLDPSRPCAFCSPVVVNLDGGPCNPVGKFPIDYYPLDLIRFVERYQLGEFKLRSGWFISPLPAVRPRQPFRELMSRLYAARSQSPLASYFLKRVMTGIVGRLLETRRRGRDVVKYGDLYNPVYHAVITSQTKIRVAEFIIQNGITASELVHVGVDGIKATRYIPLPAQSSKMGQWVCRGSRPAIVLSPGRIYTSDKPGGGATYHLLSAIAQARPNQRRYAVNGTVVDLNTLHLDLARNFGELPRTCRALLESKFGSEAVVL